MEQKAPTTTWVSRGQLVVLEGQHIAVGQDISSHNAFHLPCSHTPALKEGPPAEEGVRTGRKLRLSRQNAQERRQGKFQGPGG